MKKLFWIFLFLFTPSIGWAQALPEANLRVSPSTGDLTTVFTLDASGSQATQGYGSQLEYQFKPSSTAPRTSFQRSPQFTFRANQPGTFNAQLWVRDTLNSRVTTTYQRYSVRQEVQRSVRISVSNLNPIEGDTVTYTAVVFGTNLDRNQIQTRWDFNSDGRFETPFQNGLSTTFPATEGSSEPTVEVLFTDGLRITRRGLSPLNTSRSRSNTRPRLSVSTQAPLLRAPVINTQPSVNTGTENTLFTFDGSNTIRRSGSYLEWIIDGRTIKNKEKITYRFSSSGKKVVTLRHCLNQAQPICEETNLTLNLTQSLNDQYLDVTWTNLTDRGRQPLTQDYARVTASDRVRFTARTLGQPSRDQKFRYRWDFNGDGEWDTDFNDRPSAEYTFNQTGKMAVVLEALPSLTSAKFTSLQHYFPVYVERNRAPQGSFDFTKEGNFVGEKVYYTAKTSDEQSGHQVEVRFDSDADGVWDSDFRRQLSWWWQYDLPGDYPVRMQVRDPQGRVTDVKKTMTILPMPAPEAMVKVSHRNQVAGKTILLDATTSLGRDLTYEWKVLGQPQIKLHNARTNLKLDAGDYTVCLTVRDRLGVENTLEFLVTFVAPEEFVTTTPQNQAVEASPNLLQWLPGAPPIDNYVLPPGGVPRGPSPFVIEAGTAIPDDGYVSGMRAR